jgi:glycine C-acetyltransferase
MGRVDILTGTLGKALGGASGGYTAGPKAVIDLLRQTLPALLIFELASASNGCRIDRVLEDPAKLP